MMVTSLCSPLLRRPLLLLAVCWAGGIVLATACTFPPLVWLISAAILLTIWLLLQHTLPVPALLAVLLAVAAVSAGFTTWKTAPPMPGDAAYLPTGGVMIAGYPLTPPTVEAYGWRGVFRVTERRAGSLWLPVRGDIDIFGRQGDPPQPGRYYRLLGRTAVGEGESNPYQFSSAQYLATRGMHYQMRVYTVLPSTSGAPQHGLQRLRESISTRLAATLPSGSHPLYAQVLDGLLFGIHGTPLPETLESQFRRAGTIHLMVVSGSQITLLGSLLLLPLVLVHRRSTHASYPVLRSVLLILSLPLLGLYVAIADRGASVDRALVMFLLLALSLFLTFSPLARQRSYRPDLLTLWAAAGWLLLLGKPSLLFSPGMQLSFAAVFGLLTITPVLLRLLHRWPGWLAMIFAGTLGAQLMVFPVLAWHFGTVPVLGVLTNLLAVPAVGVLLPFGLCAVGFSFVLPGVATFLQLAVLIPLMRVLLATSAAASRIPWAEMPCYTRSWWTIALYLAALGIGTLALSRLADRMDDGWNIPAGREPRMW